MFDPKRLCTTRDGRKAEILPRKLHSKEETLIAIITTENGDEVVHGFYTDGRWLGDIGETVWDLINIPEKRTLRGWVNVLQDPKHVGMVEGAWFDTRGEADSAAEGDDIGLHRIACIEITREFEEGEGL